MPLAHANFLRESDMLKRGWLDNALLLVPVLGVVWMYLVFFPGIKTPDSLHQLLQANLNEYVDWHPPLMAWLWGKLNHIFPETSGIMWLHIFLLWTALIAYARLIPDSRSALIYLFGFMPMVVGLTGIVWKDITTTYMLLWCLVFFLLPRTRWYVTAFLVCVWLAVALRYNTLFSALPIVFFYFLGLFQEHHRSRPILFAVTATVAVMAAVFLSARAFTYDFIKAKESYPQIVILVDDLSYFSLQEQRSLVPGVDYSAVEHSARQWTYDNFFRLKLPNTKEYYDEVKAAWEDAVLADPARYLKFRLSVFVRFLGISLDPPFATDAPSIDYGLQLYHVRDVPNTWKESTGQYIIYVADRFPFLFAGYFWLAFDALLFLFLLFYRNIAYRHVLLALGASGTLNAMSYLLVANSNFYRYIYWTVLAGLLALFFIYFGLRSRTRD